MNGGGGSVAILCPGPSLSRFLDNRPRHDTFIAVNRAASAFCVDWWAVQDEDIWRSVRPIGKPIIFSSDSLRDTFGNREPGNGFEWTTFSEVGSCTKCRSKPPWWSYTLTAALVLADHISADEITIYGADMEGLEDWDGHVPASARSGRSEHRWERERYIFGHVIGWLQSERGINVTREVLSGENAHD